jgi:hypothetical protein
MAAAVKVSKSLVLSLLALLLLGSFVLVYVPTIQDAHASGGLSIDGTASNSGCASPCTIDLTTSDPNDIIVVFFQANAGITVSGVADTGAAGLTFSTRFACAGANRAMCEYYAVSTSALTNEPIQITTNAGANVNAFMFGVNGANTATPYDTNAGVPNEATQNSDSSAACTVSTSNANDMIITDVADGGTTSITNPSGFSTIIGKMGGAPAFAGAYEVVSSTQSSRSVSWTLVSTATGSEALCDAIQSAVSVPISLSIQNGAATDSALVTCAGGGGTYTASAGTQSFTCDGGTSVTVALTAGGANNQWCFSGECTSSEIFTACSSGTCSTQSYNYYEEFQNTWQASTNGNGPPTWDSLLSITPTGEQGGSAGHSICTISPTSATTTTASCTGWTDYNTAVTAPSAASGAGSNIRWMLSGTSSYSPMTGGNTETAFTYYKQLQNTYKVTSNYALHLALDGTGNNECITSTSCSATLSTLDKNDVVVAACYGAGSGLTFSISDTSGLTWTQRSTTYSPSNNRQIAVFYATASSALSSDSTKCTSSVNSNLAVILWGVNGANTASPFDSNLGLPGTHSGSSASPSCTISTSNGNDFLFAVGQTVGAVTWSSSPGGFSLIAQNTAAGPSAIADYEIVSSTQSSVAESWVISGSGNWAAWCDAIVAASPFDSGLTFAITGTSLGSPGQAVCSISPASTASVASCNGYADYGTVVSFPTNPTGQAASTRWEVSGTSTFTDTTGGNAHNVNYYKQLQNTYQVTPNAQSTWDSGLTAQNVVGSLLGTSGQTVCSITLTSGSGAQSCTAYADYNTAAVIGSAIIGGAPANSQWLRSGACSFIQTTDGNTNNCNYYKQWTETWQVTANAQSTFDSGLSTTVSGIVLGVASTTICTVSLTSGQATGTCNGYIDNNQAATFSTTMSGAGSNVQWKCGTCTTASQTSGGNTVNINYYKQLQNTYQATPNAQLTWDAGLSAPAVTGTVLGVGSASVCTLTLTSGSGAASCSGWADYNLPVSLGTIGGAPANSRWEARGTTSFTDNGTGGNTYNVDYHKQYTLTMTGGNGIAYSVSSQTGDGYWDSGTTLTVSSNGVYDRAAGTGQRVSSWNVDGGASTLVATVGTVTTSPLTMDAPHAVNFGEVTQYEVILDSTSTSALAACTPPTITGDDYWYDGGTATVTCSLNGVWGRLGGTGNRLASYSVDGATPTPVNTTGIVAALGVAAISSPQSIVSTSVTQYLLALSASPPSAGLVSYGTSPTISGDAGWYDSGTTVSFSVALHPGFQFTGWLGTGACSYSGGLTSTSVILTCAASESATFVSRPSYVLQSITLEGMSSPGLTTYFAIDGCGALPDSIPGDGAAYSIKLDPSCSFTVSIFNTGSTRYGFSVSGMFSDTSPDETSCATGTCSPITIVYYEQVNEQFAYAISDGSIVLPAPTLTCVQLGSPGPCGVLTESASSYWLDYASSWSATNPLGGSNGTIRWEAATPSGLVSAPSSIVVVYSHQFLVSFEADPQAGGVTEPASGTSQWVDSGSDVGLSASAANGYSFSSWTASGPGGVTFSNDDTPSTTASIGGPAVITAHFGLALVSVTFSESGLPAGMTWSVTVGEHAGTSNTTSIEFELSPGSYSWSVLTPLSSTNAGVRFIASTSSGTISVTGPSAQQVSFVTQYYLVVGVASTASGVTLTPASGWYDAGSELALNATADPSTYLTFVSWAGTGSGSYSGPDTAALLSMNGPMTETANFAPEMGMVTFVESGLPDGAEWSVVANGVNESTFGDSITFSDLAVGSTVDWVVQSPTSTLGMGTLQVLSANTTTVTVTFTTSPTTVTSTSTTTVVSTTVTITVGNANSTATSSTSTGQGTAGVMDLDYALIALVAILLTLLILVTIRLRSTSAGR